MKTFSLIILTLGAIMASPAPAEDLGRQAAELNSRSVELYGQGRYDEAIATAGKALESAEKAFGKDHLTTSRVMANLGEFYRVVARYREAEALFTKVIEMRERSLGKDHPDVASVLNNLGLTFLAAGRYADAEPLLVRALAIREKAFGKEHPDCATSLSNLAALYNATARYEEAEQLFRSSLEIREKVLGRDHPDTGTSLNNLAALYSVTGRPGDAETLLKRSLALHEKAFGKDHPHVGAVLNNLATLYESAARYDEAETLYKRAAAIAEKAFGRDHPNRAVILNSLAMLYKDRGRDADAELLFRDSLSVREKAFGRDHPQIATTLMNLAFLYASGSRHTEAHDLFTRSLAIADKTRDNVFLVLSDRQKTGYLNEKEIFMHAFTTHTARYLVSDPASVKDTFNAWLRWKGAVLEAQGRYLQALYASDDPELQRQFDELLRIRRDLAKLQLSKPRHMSFEDYRNTILQLGREKEAREAELTRKSREYSAARESSKADVNRLLKILPRDSLYLDFAKVTYFDFRKREREQERYLVYVLLPHSKPQVHLIDLSDAEEMDRHIRAYRTEINRVKESGKLPDAETLRKEAQALYKLLIEPVAPFLKGKRQVLISPDGLLNLLPLEALMAPDGTFLVEALSIGYIAAGRDIVRFPDKTTVDGDALILADPDFDLGLKERESVTRELRAAAAIRGAVCRDAAELDFPPLPDTKDEAEAIEKILKEKLHLASRNYQGKQAVEEVLFSAKRVPVLHLATHGFFLEDRSIGNENLRGVKITVREDFEKDVPMNSENPMLRSGIVFAGVNASLREGRDEGMVTAEKILGLKLTGTDLVVLSACETGVGEVENGEGVFGLKRAFLLSGAQSLVMSLWSVPSRETTELMTRFYTLLGEKKPKAEALRQAKLGIMKKKKNPFFWGAFILVGNPD